jgi:phosphoribosylformimino-5-aminoimidazole carboxamide ribotide isomerase
MLIYPAIDIFDGKAVRLTRGDYEKMTVYSDDPVGVARGFKKAGATAAHIVDLDGARMGIPMNLDIIGKVAQEIGPEVQVGGGIRNAEIAEEYMNLGVRRIIVGTAAVAEPQFLKFMVREYGDAVAVAVDIKDGRIAIKGWTEISDKSALEFCLSIEEYGVRTIVCTDVSKDGMLGGANMELYHTLRDKLQIRLLASGGIAKLDEVKKLSALGMDGALIGKALYTGDIDLAEAIAAAATSKREK